MSNDVLIVEDEKKLANLLKDYLEQSGFMTAMVSDGDQVIEKVNSYRPNLILLDIMLPNRDGISICREIRQSSLFRDLPVIMTTAKVDEIDRLLGLEMGADDYVCKPYSPREVVARVKAVLRRREYPKKAAHIGLDLGQEKMRATYNNKNLNLTAVEYTLLSLMAEVPGRIYSRSKLMDNIYKDYRIVSERTIDSHIKKLRKKIAAVDSSIELVHSVYGVGYKVESPDIE